MQQLVFNHIPKTGGITLRIILDRIYGEENIFLVKSTDIGDSLKIFRNFSSEERARYRVIEGHAAELFSPYIPYPFRITILREPVSLFLSQYYFLKTPHDHNFYEDVSKMATVEDYLEYAIEKGQDNLLIRYLSNSVGFLADPSLPVPDLREEGEDLLAKALKALDEYDAIIDLGDFDAGVFGLASQLGWKKIPVYRPSNRNSKNPGRAALSKSTSELLQEALKYDIALYETFIERNLAIGEKAERNSFSYRLFTLRQQAIKVIANVLRKS